MVRHISLNWLRLPALAALLLVVGCASNPKHAQTPQFRTEDDLYDWHPEGLTGKTTVTIDLQRQVAEVFIGGERAGWCYVATGKEGYDTEAGEFKILEKIADKKSDTYGWIVDADGQTIVQDAKVGRDKPPKGGEFVHAPMPYWMRISWHGIGMHAGIIPQPGQPASHGCIRMPHPFAPLLFDVVKVGTPVTVIK
ncbi:hypothetical protein BH09VER1_BH09VER1_04250 [soil metagenome]